MASGSNAGVVFEVLLDWHGWGLPMFLSEGSSKTI